jgi:hypothetical protein
VELQLLSVAVTVIAEMVEAVLEHKTQEHLELALQAREIRADTDKVAEILIYQAEAVVLAQ